MKSKVFSSIFCLLSALVFGQSTLRGKVVIAEEPEKRIPVQIYDRSSGFLKQIFSNEAFSLSRDADPLTLFFIADGYPAVETTVNSSTSLPLLITIGEEIETLSEVVLSARKKEVFALKRMRDYEKTAIFAGKKNEVVLVEQSMANLATNNARQIFNQVPGLNIYQNDDAGLQLHIGGRGLDPNRTSNFNTRQNGYDISADVLGYPESYYTPPAEALEEIQIIRGAASLQYGTQFGGLVNFKLKEPLTYKTLAGTTRNTVGSNGLFTHFTRLEGRVGKWRYATYFNAKKGEGFRPNSGYESQNLFGQLIYDFSPNTLASVEITYLDYLAQQAGGLTDQMFAENPFQSNRQRNWFGLYWLLYNAKFEHSFSENTNFSFSFFGLNAQRNAVGFRSNRVSQIDPNQERDLIKGDFNNYGFETRLLHKYALGKTNAVFLVGGKYYRARNTSEQGPGSNLSDADFRFYTNDFPTYSQQSSYLYPNENMALFMEHIFYINHQLSVTPGVRFEHIATATDGSYLRINTDAAGNVILNEREYAAEKRNRSFSLLGLGLSYKPFPALESYANFSQNYRSVTFTDISIINPAYTINPNISDEKGYSMDIGFRGQFKKTVSFDTNFFFLAYQNRIGFIQKAYRDGSVKSERGNIGDAEIYGIESLIDINVAKGLGWDANAYIFNVFLNYSQIESAYTASGEASVVGKEVEFVPQSNLKTGVKLGYKNVLMSLQYTGVSSQFTDSSNAVEGNISGVIGQIPAYSLLDLSFSTSFKSFKIEAGVNNLTNEHYFTRRATGYPGPGIIPSPNRNIFTTLQYRF